MMNPMKKLTLFLKSLPTGARWITVHPHGKSEKGVPVMVQESKSGSGVYRVIGGAGGSLNYLKFRGLKSEKEYRQAAAAKKAAKREEKNKQRKLDKESGVYEVKKSAKQGVADSMRQKEQDFIHTVADAMGWNDTDFNEDLYSTVSDAARNKAALSHHSNQLKRANEAVELQRKSLLSDAKLQREDGSIDMDTISDDLSIQDLDPVRSAGSGLGYTTNYKERSGLSDDEIKQESDDELSDDEISKRSERSLRAKNITDELKNIREPLQKESKLINTKRAVDLLKAQKEMRVIQKKASEANRSIDRGEIKTYTLEVTDEDIDRKVHSDLESDLQTIQTKAFLDEFEKIGGDLNDSLGRHIGVGAYNSINSLSLVAGGSGLVDRDVVDVLGIAGASQVLARRLSNDLDSADYSNIQAALSEFHKDHYMKASKDALSQAQGWTDVANTITLDEVAGGNDLDAMQELNAKRRDATNEANKIIATTLGEMEANASLVVALKQGAKDGIEVSMGNVSISDAIVRARAIGLDRGDYKINSVGSNRFLSITGAGMDKLAKPIDKESFNRLKDAMDIVSGKQDEDDWLPQGLSRRPDLALNKIPGVAPSVAEPFNYDGNIEQSIRDYIGGRTADGDTPETIYSDLKSFETIKDIDDLEGFYSAVRNVVPLDSKKNELVNFQNDSFEDMADQFVLSRYGQERLPLHRQKIQAGSDVTAESIHRALVENPEGVLAYIPAADLSSGDKNNLRKHFYRTIAKDGDTDQLSKEIDEIKQQEPERQVKDLFGVSENPVWRDWRDSLNKKTEERNEKSLDWKKYIQVMGSREKAYATIQDTIRSAVNKKFHDTYNTLNPNNPIKIGKAQIINGLSHLSAIDKDARDARISSNKKIADSLRYRDSGKYASGGISDRIEDEKRSVAAMNQSQMDLFSTDSNDAPKDIALKQDERHTLGRAMENQIASIIDQIGGNFKPGQPTRVGKPSMNGRYINQQRAIKLIEKNKKLALAQGVGSGKTVIGLGAFAHLVKQGKAKRGIFVVPSIVQGQFHSAALKYLEPGAFKWHAEPGASREDRIKGYKDPLNHFSVVTHQSYRDDIIHLAATDGGATESEIKDKVNSMTVDERKSWVAEVMKKAGMDHDYMMIDEGHDLLNRAGKENSTMANVLDAVGHNMSYYVNASADPVKNDSSEIFSLLQKMDPERYSDRDKFMRRYGVDTVSSKDALKRELSKYTYPGKIDPGVSADKKEINVPLSNDQKKELKQIDRNVQLAKQSRSNGVVNIDAMKNLAPKRFNGVNESDHESIAKNLQENLGLLRNSAINAAINNHPKSEKLNEVVRFAGDRSGKPGVVFAHSIDAVNAIAEKLKKEGHSVTVLTGADSAKEKAAKKQAFSPDSGEATADIIVASDAGSVGANLQRGQWLIQYDTPMTAKTWHQRNGRIHRLGQKNNVELVDLVSDHQHERSARERLYKKNKLRDVLTSSVDGLDDTGLAGYLSRVKNNQESLNG